MNQYHKQIGIILKDAWQSKDMLLLHANLSTDGLRWHESAFEKPLIHPDSVIEQWEKDLARQSDIRVQLNLLDWVENRGYHHCTAFWIDKKGQRHAVDAIFAIHLDTEGKIIYFTPWYTSKN